MRGKLTNKKCQIHTVSDIYYEKENERLCSQKEVFVRFPWEFTQANPKLVRSILFTHLRDRKDSGLPRERSLSVLEGSLDYQRLSSIT